MSVECEQVWYNMCDCTELETPYGKCCYYKFIVGNNANMCELCTSSYNDIIWKRILILSFLWCQYLFQYFFCIIIYKTDIKLFWIITILIIPGVFIIFMIVGLFACRLFIALNYIMWYLFSHIIFGIIYLISVLLSRIVNPHFAFQGMDWLKGFGLCSILCVSVIFCVYLKYKYNEIKEILITQKLSNNKQDNKQIIIVNSDNYIPIRD